MTDRSQTPSNQTPEKMEVQMDNVFILHHTYGDSESESYKLLGVFSTEDRANSEIPKYLKLPGFKEFPDGFTVTKYSLDEPHWLSGFEGAQSSVIEDK